MSVIGNIIWILTGGLVGAIMWCAAGIALCITVVGIPFGVQCFKIAGLQLAPFGRQVVSDGEGSTLGVIGNVLWVLLIGWILALAHVAIGIAFAVTIIGIPFAVQSFKLAVLSLAPFGRRIV
jgi:uncharacterized membrane protein YccF (DUF307 family)